LGGTQSLHTNGYDEALSLPTEEAATIALRTQQIIAHESGVADTVDPLAGSYAIESLTDEIEERARDLIQEVEDRGGAVEAIERGFIQDQIAQSAFDWEVEVQSGKRKIVGVNFQRSEREPEVPIHGVDEERVERQIERTKSYKESQDSAQIDRVLEDVRSAAVGDVNLLPVMREALLAGATLGQICGVLREEWGEYRPRI
ncbi:MAG: methylmalonyl-CoA mutase family protein, partial [Chloroflexota bacterium]